jgi:hypothetical protein
MNKLLSEQYRRVLEHEHGTTGWGVTGWKHAPRVHDLAVAQGVQSLLDYGAGRGSLGHWFDQHAPETVIERREYEPGIARLSTEPQPAELVVCVDVMEHIEPDCMDAVLDHIQSLATRCVYFNISCRPAGRILSDGRNAHLVVKPQSWWRKQLAQRWEELEFHPNEKIQDLNWIGLVRS